MDLRDWYDEPTLPEVPAPPSPPLPPPLNKPFDFTSDASVDVRNPAGDPSRVRVDLRSPDGDTAFLTLTPDAAWRLHLKLRDAHSLPPGPAAPSGLPRSSTCALDFKHTAIFEAWRQASNPTRLLVTLDDRFGSADILMDSAIAKRLCAGIRWVLVTHFRAQDWRRRPGW